MLFDNVINDILHHDSNMSYDNIRKLSQRYVNRLKEYANILTINLMWNTKISSKLKRRLPQDVRIAMINCELITMIKIESSYQMFSKMSMEHW